MHGNNWHLTYCTAITLLLAFVILIFALHLYAPAQTGDEDIYEEGIPRSQSSFPQVSEQILRYISSNSLDGYISISYSEEYLFICFADNFLFERSFGTASSRLDSRELEILNFMGSAVKSIEDEAAVIYVAGHAEPWDGHSGSNRMLSAERANAVLMHLEDNTGIDPEKLTLLAFGNNFLADGSPGRVEILIENSSGGIAWKYFLKAK
ncbi:MAG: OmpA family protein [Oscillospiraceae bacterium]|nr:OmpA family protein [Oscillospiraceae bacterium]